MSDRTEAAARGLKGYDAVNDAFRDAKTQHPTLRAILAQRAADAVPRGDAEVETACLALQQMENILWKEGQGWPELPNAVALLRSLAAREAALREEVEHLKEQVVHGAVGGFEAGIAQGREEAAKVAEEHKGRAKAERQRRWKPNIHNVEALPEIEAEEHGEDIAAEMIAAAIRALGERVT